MRRADPLKKKLLAVLCVLSLAIGIPSISKEQAKDPYIRPEAVREIYRVRDLLFNGQYEETAAECRRAQAQYPDLLVWHFAAMLAPQARMLELHDYSLEKGYLAEWNKMTELFKRIQSKRTLFFYDHLCMGGGLGIYGLHHARARHFRKAFTIGYQALQELGKAKDADPSNDDVYLGFGIYHYYRGVLSTRLKWLPFFSDDKARGMAELDRARKGLFAEPLVDAAEMYLYKDEGKWTEGLKIARKLRAKYPQSNLAAQHEGFFLLRLGDYETALREFDAVIAADPKNGSLYLYRGETLFRLNRVEEAESAYWKCINLGASDEYKAYSYYFLGLIAQARGDIALAEKYWKEALQLYPDYREVQQLIESARKGDQK